MRVTIHRENEEVVQSVDYARAITSLRFKRGWLGNLETVFTDGKQIVELEGGAIGTAVLKLKNAFTSSPLAKSTWSKTGSGVDTVYVFPFNLLTDEILAVFSGENANLPSVEVMFEIEWQESAERKASIVTIYGNLFNNVNKADEGLPTPANPGYWDKDEADARFLFRDEVVVGEGNVLNGGWFF